MKIKFEDLINENFAAHFLNFLLLIWFQYIIFDKVANLRFLTDEIFYPRGIYRILDFYTFLLQHLLILKYLIIVLLIWITYKPSRSKIFLFLFFIYFYELIKKGFGGHIDHRISTLFLFTLIFVLAIDKKFENLKYAITISYIFYFISYFFIGIARLFNGFPDLFVNETFYKWVLQRNLRPSFFENLIDIELLINSNIYPLNLLLVFSTIIEIISIFVIFSDKKFVKLISISLIFFHIGIYLIMSINFIENIFLLVLLLIMIKKKV